MRQSSRFFILALLGTFVFSATAPVFAEVSSAREWVRNLQTLRRTQSGEAAQKIELILELLQHPPKEYRAARFDAGHSQSAPLRNRLRAPSVLETPAALPGIVMALAAAPDANGASRLTSFDGVFAWIKAIALRLGSANLGRKQDQGAIAQIAAASDLPSVMSPLRDLAKLEDFGHLGTKQLLRLFTAQNFNAEALRISRGILYFLTYIGRSPLKIPPIGVLSRMRESAQQLKPEYELQGVLNVGSDFYFKVLHAGKSIAKIYVRSFPQVQAPDSADFYRAGWNLEKHKRAWRGYMIFIEDAVNDERIGAQELAEIVTFIAAEKSGAKPVAELELPPFVAERKVAAPAISRATVQQSLLALSRTQQFKNRLLALAENGPEKELRALGVSFNAEQQAFIRTENLTLEHYYYFAYLLELHARRSENNAVDLACYEFLLGAMKRETAQKQKWHYAAHALDNYRKFQRDGCREYCCMAVGFLCCFPGLYFCFAHTQKEVEVSEALRNFKVEDYKIQGLIASVIDPVFQKLSADSRTQRLMSVAHRLMPRAGTEQLWTESMSSVMDVLNPGPDVALQSQ